MPRLAANLTMLFDELPFLDRFGAAAQAGFRGVECLFPYAFHADRIADRLDHWQLDLVLHNLPAGDWAAGERGIACLPGREAEFRDGVHEAIAYARQLGTRQLNCLAGIVPDGLDRKEAHGTLVGNLRFAAAELERAGLRLLVEPINRFDIPGFFLTGTGQALDLIDETGADNLFLQYDVYHMQRMEGDIAATLRARLPRIAHVQVADVPGRNEPGTGELNWPFLFAWLDRIGYAGWVGCEYRPREGTRAGLGWMQALAA